MFIISNNTLETVLNCENITNEAIEERLCGLKAIISIIDTEKDKKRVYGEIKYLEDLIMEKEVNYEG